ncbi:MAG: hypothetical protein NTW98_01795 [Candidatus Nomurabacteria bacterium]|nr:hypothetical protein [Candidatus Nomurabacteria bacterium]
MTETIYGTDIDHSGDVNDGLTWLRRNWNDAYVLDQFANAKRGPDYKAYMKIPNESGTYILKYISEHHFSFSWVNEN